MTVIENPQVTGRIEQGVIVLTVNYVAGLMFQDNAYSLLSQRLVQEYDTRLKDNPRTRSCVIVIRATTAGSPMVSALFELWEKVTNLGGQVICVGYPTAYIDSLTTVGLLDLHGFSQAGSEREAVSHLAPAGKSNQP